LHKNEVRLNELMPFFLERLAAGESVKFTPQGTSMTPMILGGRDQVILSPPPKQWKKYDLPFYQRDNGQYVLHRIVEVGERPGLEPGEVDKFTVVIWLEGEDPECMNDILGGTIEMMMKLRY